MTEPRFGVLAEDDSDGRTVRVLARKILGTPKICMDWFADNGCATLRRKAERWIKELVSRGCDHIIILHDLDRNPITSHLNDEEGLRRVLNGYHVPPGVRKLICIPVEELEAWFWADPAIIKKIGGGKGKAHPSPDKISCPKERLMKLSRDAGGKPRYSTNDNSKLAESLDIETCAAKCRSFADLRDFLLGAVGRLPQRHK